jgi:hypothetical protein
MDYTPRQMQAFIVIAEQRRRETLRLDLFVGTLAARGDERAVRNQMNEWDGLDAR